MEITSLVVSTRGDLISGLELTCLYLFSFVSEADETALVIFFTVPVVDETTTIKVFSEEIHDLAALTT